jgi:YD repeat-containing protein
VVVSGWKIYNNKGKVVEQWEPYYSSGFDYQEEESHAGQKIKMYYDGPGRMIRTVNPDDSENRVYFGRCEDIEVPEEYIPTPWERYSYDANDLAGITHPGGSSVPNDHKYTPKSETMDALGNVIQTTEHQAHDAGTTMEDVVMKYEFDIKGRLLKVLDPYDREVFDYKYDALDKPLYTEHIDSRESTVVYDVLDNPVMTLDAKGAESLHNIDHLARPTHVWAKNKTGDSFTLRNHLAYGDTSGLSTPEADNLKGQVYLDYDEAGLTQFPEYDFKGNLLEKRRQVIKDSELKTVFDGPPANWDIQPYVVDWDGLDTSILETKKYITEIKYDGLTLFLDLAVRLLSCAT